MMAHARQQVREALATQITGLTTTGSSVYQSRTYPVNTLPSITVMNTRDEVREETQGGNQRRSLAVTLTCRAKAKDDVDDTLDTIAAEVETAVNADPKLGGRVIDTALIVTDIEYADGGEQPIGVLRMEYEILYLVNKADVSVLI